ncbi:MAG: ATP-binding protein [Fimbriimonadaceae bacterium]|nr:ATP-binding protein [Fimbriimonadaceae bacterium]
MINAARGLFDQFVTQGYQRVLHAIERHEAESEILDFKTEPRQEDLQKLLGKVATAFANTSGGVIVWGVNSKNGASDLKQVVDLAAFELAVADLTNQAATYPLSGVTHHRIYDPGSTKSGYLITYVPESDNKPHQSTDGYYYMRSGSNSVRMGHQIIRGLMLATGQPRFVLKIGRPTAQFAVGDDLHYWAFKVLALNTGQFAARLVDCVFTCDPPLRTHKALVGSSPHYINTITADGHQAYVITIDRELCCYPFVEMGLVQIELPHEAVEQSTELTIRLFAQGYAGLFRTTLTRTDFNREGLQNSNMFTPMQGFELLRELEAI